MEPAAGNLSNPIAQSGPNGSLENAVQCDLATWNEEDCHHVVLNVLIAMFESMPNGNFA